MITIQEQVLMLDNEDILLDIIKTCAARIEELKGIGE